MNVRGPQPPRLPSSRQVLGRPRKPPVGSTFKETVKNKLDGVERWQEFKANPDKCAARMIKKLNSYSKKLDEVESREKLLRREVRRDEQMSALCHLKFIHAYQVWKTQEDFIKMHPQLLACFCVASPLSPGDVDLPPRLREYLRPQIIQWRAAVDATPWAQKVLVTRSELDVVRGQLEKRHKAVEEARERKRVVEALVANPPKGVDENEWKLASAMFPDMGMDDLCRMLEMMDVEKQETEKREKEKLEMGCNEKEKMKEGGEDEELKVEETGRELTLEERKAARRERLRKYLCNSDSDSSEDDEEQEDLFAEFNNI